ncbi:HepT-like ribonuclease domain-containing protein [Thermoanaerobacter sp. A7A]|uniref:DUF86 domain-containing protein n=1 Tax=Thermoanaerobacter sp. A7A TaxID=1350366 RepID=UPI00235B6B46|nr:HepT-like ribonuclease domain-containing protein [Thermoanaerobacter sp. A7A]
MNYKDVIRRKLISLSNYVKQLLPITEYTYEEYISNYFIYYTGERLVQLIIETCMDINSLIIEYKGLRPGYPNCTKVYSLGSWGICSPPFRLSQPQQAVFGKVIAPAPRSRNSRSYKPPHLP